MLAMIIVVYTLRGAKTSAASWVPSISDIRTDNAHDEEQDTERNTQYHNIYRLDWNCDDRVCISCDCNGAFQVMAWWIPITSIGLQFTLIPNTLVTPGITMSKLFSEVSSEFGLTLA